MKCSKLPTNQSRYRTKSIQIYRDPLKRTPRLSSGVVCPPYSEKCPIFWTYGGRVSHPRELRRDPMYAKEIETTHKRYHSQRLAARKACIHRSAGILDRFSRALFQHRRHETAPSKFSRCRSHLLVCCIKCLDNTMREGVR